MSMLLEIQNPEGFDDIPVYADFELWANACWLNEEYAGVVIRVVGEMESRNLNRGFRGRDYATNVLSFRYEQVPMYADYADESGSDEIDYLGDLVICKPVIEGEASTQNKQIMQHWAHMVVHGLLHLQGFEHETDIEAKLMEAREITILRELGFPNPYEAD